LPFTGDNDDKSVLIKDKKIYQKMASGMQLISGILVVCGIQKTNYEKVIDQVSSILASFCFCFEVISLQIHYLVPVGRVLGHTHYIRILKEDSREKHSLATIIITVTTC